MAKYHLDPNAGGGIIGLSNSRRSGARDWIRFIENPEEDLAAIADEIGVDFSKPCVALLTNVAWARPIIVRNMLRLAFASGDPVIAVRAFLCDIRAQVDTLQTHTRQIVDRALADGLRSIALALWRQGSYRRASAATLCSIYYHPAQVLEKGFLRRTVRAVAGMLFSMES